MEMVKHAAVSAVRHILHFESGCGVYTTALANSRREGECSFLAVDFSVLEGSVDIRRGDSGV